MKKINVLLIALLFVGAIGFTSCDPEVDNVAAPSITFTQGTQTVLPNTAVTIEADITAAGSIGTIQMKKDGTDYGDPFTSGFDSDTATHFSFTIPADQVTADFEFQLEVTDLQKDPKTQLSSTAYITLDDLIVFVNDIEIHCAQADQSSVDYASATTGETWSHDAAENDAEIIAKIDFCYYNGNYTKLDRHRMVSPDATPDDIHKNNYGNGSHEDLTGANTTKFKILSGTELDAFSDWNNVSDDTGILAITDINSENALDFVVDDIVAFELDNGKKGVFKVQEYTDGYTSTDYVIIDVIVQKFEPTTK